MKTFEEAVKSFSHTHNKNAEALVDRYDGLRTEIAASQLTETLASGVVPFVFSHGLHGALMMAFTMGVEVGIEMEKADLPEVTA